MEAKYSDYDGFQRAEVGKWAIANGIRPAARKFDIPESTIRGIIKTYKESVVNTPTQTLLQLPKEINKKIIAMIKNMRSAGTIVSYNITISIAKGLILANDRTFLKENGGNIDVVTSWAHSVHQRLDFVRRKFTTCKQPVSPGFLKEVGFSFYHQIDEIVSKYNIPSELIINVDQTPLPFFLIFNYTLAPNGDQELLRLSTNH